MKKPMNQPRRAIPVISVLAALAFGLAACTSGQVSKPHPSPAPEPVGFYGISQFRPEGPPPAITVLPRSAYTGSKARPQITVPPIPAADSGAIVSFPLDSYEAASFEAQDSLNTATEQLTQRCMSAAGFSYPLAITHPDDVAKLQLVEHLSVGLTSVAQARSFGFNPVGAVKKFLTQRSRPMPGFAQYQRQHGTAWASALLGAVPGAPASAQHLGCRRTASLLLYGTLTGNPNSDGADIVYFPAYQFALSDPRYLAAQRVWSACLARHGLTYSTPDDLEFSQWPATPTPVEIADAVTDVRCKQQANLANTYLTLEAAYEQTLIGLNAASLAELQSDFSVLQQRAQHLLQQPPAVLLRFSQHRPPG